MAPRRASESAPPPGIVSAPDAGARPRHAPERVARRGVDRVEQRAEAAPLVLVQARGVQRLERLVEHSGPPGRILVEIFAEGVVQLAVPRAQAPRVLEERLDGDGE